MPAIITEHFRVFNAKQYKDSLAANTTYFGIGRTLPWGEFPNEDGELASDLNPPFPAPTSTHFFDAWRDMIALKRVGADRASHAIPRHNWTSGIVYDKADSRDPAIFQRRFYVMNSQYRLYKCLDNNSGVASTNEPDPTGTQILGSAPFLTADGYKWVYVYELSQVEIDNFLTLQHIPVTDTTDPVPSPGGSIDSVTILNGGSGLVNPVTVSIAGDGTGAVVGTVTVLSGAITNIAITAGGSDYTFADLVITDGLGPVTSVIAYPNISPNGGHGFNLLEELGAFFITLSARFEYDESGLVTVDNDYRKIVIVRDPTATTPGPLLTAYDTIQLSATAPSSFEPDQLLTGDNGATGRIIEVSGDIVKMNRVTGLWVGATTATNGADTPGVIAHIAPNADHNSGSIDYIEYRRPINRTADQVEELRVTIEW